MTPRFADEMLYVYADDERTARMRVSALNLSVAGITLETVELTDGETEAYVEHTMFVDDGEAQAIAIAQCRAIPVLTDDRAGIRRAERTGVDVLTTLDLLHQWSRDKPEAVVLRACHRLRARGRFAPPNNHALAGWYTDCLADHR